MTDLSPEVPPKRTYKPRIDAGRKWLQKRGPGPVTPAEMTQGLGWPPGVAVKVLGTLARQGMVVRLDRGMYAVPELATFKPPKAPKAPKVVADPYAVVDLVLDELFPDGIRAVHLQQVIEWREATVELLRLMSPEGG